MGYFWIAVGTLLVVAAAVAEWQYQKSLKRIEKVGNPAEVAFTRLLFVLCLLFERERMALVASVCDWEIWEPLRWPVLWVVALVLNADRRELKQPLHKFRTIGDFFSRELKDGARPPDVAPGAVLSPADARVLAFGAVSDPSGRVAQVEVKGTTFSLAGLLGTDPLADLPPGSALMYVALHLGPQDYHRFHSPADYAITSGRRFAGEGLPVSPVVSGRTNDVFCVNERLVLSGRWSGGRMHMVAVGAAHVRGIFLECDDHLSRELAPPRGRYFLDGKTTYAEVLRKGGCVQEPGKMMGGFRLGSAIVLVFEAPIGSVWRVAPGDKVRVGQQLLAGYP